MYTFSIIAWLAFSDAVPVTVSDNAGEADRPELGAKEELKPEEEGEEEEGGENEEGDEEQINTSTTDPPVSLIWGKVLAVLIIHRNGCCLNISLHELPLPSLPPR